MGLIKRIRNRRRERYKKKSGGCNVGAGFCSGGTCEGQDCSNVVSSVNTKQKSLMGLSAAGADSTYVIWTNNDLGGPDSGDTKPKGICFKDVLLGTENSVCACPKNGFGTRKIIGVSGLAGSIRGFVALVGCFPD